MLKKLFLIAGLLASSFFGGAFAQNFGGGLARAALTLPYLIYGPSTSGSPLGSQVTAVTNGTVNIWNPFLYGWGATATAFCVMAGGAGTYPSANLTGQNGNCPITGGVGAAASGYASYSSRDRVGFLSYIQSQAATFGSKNGTFTATTFTPTTPLTGTELGNLRVGMSIDTNDATPYSGVITGWDSGSITVSGWYSQQSPYNSGTPAGTAATISAASKIFGANIVSTRTATAGTDIRQNTTLELDCNNNSGSDDTGILEASMPTPYDGCLDAVNLGTNIASFGVIVRGKFNAGVVLTHTGLYGLDTTNMTVSSGGAPIVASLSTPSTSSDTCKQGSLKWDASFIYVCTATNTWKRATLASF